MTENDQPSENIARLLRHLREGSLAAQLVRAHCAQAGEDGSRALEEVLEERLRRIREALHVGED